jgi:hypothetical protein
VGAVTAVLDRIFRFVRPWWRDNGPQSFMTLAKAPRSKSKLPTSNLYVVETDFAVSPDTYNNLQAMLDEIREKYGLDFMILEPGFKLKRFDDY